MFTIVTRENGILYRYNFSAVLGLKEARLAGVLALPMGFRILIFVRGVRRRDPLDNGDRASVGMVTYMNVSNNLIP